ncbi:cellulose synthase operon protein YhjQ/BcsQ [Planosporangium mesophilum]|nr:cellulose synthase operon protein YhjQ/BcsQ [Planosporangium mesophilum]
MAAPAAGSSVPEVEPSLASGTGGPITSPATAMLRNGHGLLVPTVDPQGSMEPSWHEAHPATPADDNQIWTSQFPAHVRAPRTLPRGFRGSRVERVWLRAASVRPGCPVLAVSSADGGVGRSTVVAALGGLLALACPQPVLAVDVSARAWGGLVHRVGRRNAATVWDAVRDMALLTDRLQVQRLAQLGPTGLWTLVGEVELSAVRHPPTVGETVPFVDHVRTLYPLLLLDLPTADTRQVWQVLGASAVPVLVARASRDSLQHSMRLLARLRGVGLAEAADRSVLAVVATSPRPGCDVRAAMRQAGDTAGEVLSLPYDRALAQPDPIDVRSLGRASRRALVELADAVLRRCPCDPVAAATVVDPPQRWEQAVRDLTLEEGTA